MAHAVAEKSDSKRSKVSNTTVVMNVEGVSWIGSCPHLRTVIRQTKLKSIIRTLALKVLSQLPVQRAIPSALTPRQLTRFSWPVKTPTRSPFRVSQTLQVQSSYPPKRIRPEMEKATEVIPQRILSWVKVFSSRSARISNRRQDASSDPVAKASPFGKNLGATGLANLQQGTSRNTYETALMSDS